MCYVSASTEALPAGNVFAMSLLGGLDLCLHCAQLIQPIRDAWTKKTISGSLVISELRERSEKLRGNGQLTGKKITHVLCVIFCQGLSQQYGITAVLLHLLWIN